MRYVKRRHLETTVIFSNVLARIMIESVAVTETNERNDSGDGRTNFGNFTVPSAKHNHPRDSPLNFNVLQSL